MILTFGLDNVEPVWLRIFMGLTFTLLPLYGIYHIWSGVLREAFGLGQNLSANDCQLRQVKCLTMILNVVTIFFGLTAVAEVLLLLFWGVGEILFAPFPCTVCLIVVMWGVYSVTDRIPYARKEVQQAGEKLIQARRRMFIVYATVVLVIVIWSI